MSGLKAVKPKGVGQGTINTVRCYVPATNGQRLAKGDAVKLTGSGGPSLPTGVSPEAMQIPAVEAVSAGDTIYGVIEEVEYDAGRLTDPTLPASTEGYVSVSIDKDILYDIEVSANSLAVANIGNNFDLVATAATLSGGIGKSNMKLNVASAGTSSAQVRLQGFRTQDDGNQIARVWIVELREETATGV
jgi:hypothetical protein